VSVVLASWTLALLGCWAARSEAARDFRPFRAGDICHPSSWEERLQCRIKWAEECSAPCSLYERGKCPTGRLDVARGA
jgi:hypothetical protein